MHIARVGTFRQRYRRTEDISRQQREQRRRRIQSQTHEAIDDFEGVIRATEAAREAAELSDLQDAENARTRRHSITSSNAGGADLARTGQTTSLFWASQRNLQSTGGSRSTAHVDKDVRETRPPSPLKHYDYGCVSTRSKSVTLQNRKAVGADDSKDRLHRQGPGFFFPGSQSTQGPYGMSLQDPILIASNGHRDAAGKQPPVRWRDAKDIRPTSAPDVDRRRCLGNRSTSEGVPTTRGHAHRTERTQLVIDQRREDAFLEQLCFENGVFEGRWDKPMRWENQPIQASPPDFKWIEEADDGADPTEPRTFARRLLFGLEKLLRESYSKLSHVFAREDQGPIGVLETSVFLEGLVRTGVLEFGEATVKMLEGALVLIDDSYNGTVSLTKLGRAVAVAQAVRLRRRGSEAEVLRQSRVLTRKLYHEALLPVPAVKVDPKAKTLHTSEVQYAQFTKQQTELLAMHKGFRYKDDALLKAAGVEA